MSTKCQSLESYFQPHFAEPRAFAPTKFDQPMPWARKDMFSVLDSDSDTESNYENNNITTTNDQIIGDNKSNNNKMHAISSKGGDINQWNIDLLQSSPMEKEKVYVHPLVKQFSSKLSEKSLELCTETLGSESGSNYIDIDIYSLSTSGCKRVESQWKNVSNFGGCRKVNRGSFPPPLPSVSGSSNSVNIMHYREGGRLVMKAVLVPTTQSSCFQAERRDGRLTLRLVGDHNPNPNPNPNELLDSKPIEEDKETAECVEQYKEQNHEHEDEARNQGIYQQQELLSHEHEHEHEDQGEYTKEETEEITANKRGEMGMKKFQRASSRCIESGRKNKRLLIWEPCWVGGYFLIIKPSFASLSNSLLFFFSLFHASSSP